jgi:hypothetical protein
MRFRPAFLLPLAAFVAFAATARAQAPAPEPPPPAETASSGPTVAELLGPVGGAAAVREAPEPDAGVPSYWFMATSGLALAVGIGGAIAGGMVLGAEDDYRVALSACRAGSLSACRDGPRIVADYEDDQLAANILLFSAGGLALAALVLAFFTDFGLADPDDDESLLAAAPRLLLADGSGLALGWRF